MENNYFRYLNQKCPVCEKEFTSDDDIVVCPICGTPHHRECYKKNGECGNFDEHNKGYRWTPTETSSPATEDTIPLPPLNDTAKSDFVPPFFANEPNPFAAFPKEIADGVATEETVEFVGINAIKYIQNFFYEKSNKRTFNWAAFFFAPYWFFYRKMYKLGAIFLAITLVLSVGFSFVPSVQKLYTDMTEWTEMYQNVNELTEDELTEAYNEQSKFILENKTGTILVMLQGGISLALQILIGFKANKWYYNHTVKNIRKIKSECPDSNQQRLLLFKSGGASMGATFLAVLVNNMIVMAFEMLLTFIK